MHVIEKFIYINVKQKKKIYSSARFSIAFSKLFFFEFFSFVYAFVGAQLSIFKQFSNSNKSFEMRMFANDIVSSMWNIMNVRAFEFFTLTFSNIIIFEFISFFEDLFFMIFFIFMFFVNSLSTFIIFSFFFLFMCCNVVVLNN